MDEISTHGITYTLTDILEVIKKEDLGHMIEIGNHKSVEYKEKAATLQKTYTKAFQHSWMSLLTVECLSKL